MHYTHTYNESYMNKTPGIATYALFEMYRTASIFDEFIESLTHMVFDIMKQIDVDAEKSLFYANNFIETGWFFDEHTQTAEFYENGTPEHKHHIVVKIVGDPLTNIIEYKRKYTDSRILYTSAREKPYIDNNPIEMTINVNYFRTVGVLKQFEMAQSIAHECIHIQQMYPKNTRDVDFYNDTVMIDVDLNEMRKNGLDIPFDFKNIKPFTGCCKFTLRMFSDMELEPVHTQIELAVKNHHDYIAQYIIEKNMSDRDNMVMEFLCGYITDDIADEFSAPDLSFTQIVPYKKIFDKFKSSIEDKDYCYIFLTIKKFVDSGLLEDKHHLFDNYDLVNQSLRHKVKMNVYISDIIKTFMRKFEERFNFYISDLKDTAVKLFKEYGIFKKVDNFLATNRFNKKHVIDAYIYRRTNDDYYVKIDALNEKYSGDVINEDYLYEELVAYIEEMTQRWYRHKDFNATTFVFGTEYPGQPVLEYHRNAYMLERGHLNNIMV